MTEYIDYLVNIAAVLWAYLSSVIADSPALYIAYVFALLAVLVALGFCFWLVSIFFKWVWSLLRGSLHARY